MTALLNFVLLAVGQVFAFYAGFCLLGGPEGRILSRDSFLFGLPSLAISLLLLIAANRFVPLGGYAFAPLLVILIAWLLSVAGFHQAGFTTWLFGTAVASLALIVYWAFIQFSSRGS